jgi:hypothetical protein
MNKEERSAYRRAHRIEENEGARKRYAVRKAKGWSKVRDAAGKYVWMKDAPPRKRGRPRKEIVND